MDLSHTEVPAKRSTYLWLALLLGGIGAHRAYVGKLGQAVVSALLAITFIPGLISLIDFFRHIVKDQEAFARLYRRTAPRRTMILFVLAALAYQCLMGVAVWAYLVMNAHKGKSFQSGLIQVQGVAADLARRVTDEFFTVGPTDMSCHPSQPAACRFAMLSKCRSIACAAPMYNDSLARGIIEDQFQMDWHPVADSIGIDRAGVITITFASDFLGPYFSRVGRDIVLVPRIGGAEANLSDPSNAGHRDIMWTCARDSRTSLSPRIADQFCPHFSTLAGYKLN